MTKLPRHTEVLKWEQDENGKLHLVTQYKRWYLPILYVKVIWMYLFR